MWLLIHVISVYQTFIAFNSLFHIKRSLSVIAKSADVLFIYIDL